eukprot:CAMPEP_0202371050 /NCGR_PEP_ID=MMETSP1127-20130417/2536_1 /ASSEMBLY_ACC=CAM_ASM_000462 /TAXON_ID=3047 /ORGANISM="Dunaliella tertiolecta, Strain CCMP1320" /LENGTH=94 /DNA_ID=CAMNT_0048967165 /DNA_START=770 /DNA_END=1051 /DNA_ORIENTATION=-
MAFCCKRLLGQRGARQAFLFWQHTPVGAVHCLDPAKIIHCLIQLIVLVKAVCLQQGLDVSATQVEGSKPCPLSVLYDGPAPHPQVEVTGGSAMD